VVSRLTFTMDCADAESLAAFWSEALGYSLLGNFGAFWPLVSQVSNDEPWFVLQQVDEPKSGKNRMHVDIHAADVDAELRRLEDLGARRVSDRIVMGDACWFVMEDPEGNEFCVVRPPEATPPA
jgi:predicted enzyme related to lactoylglutathione lyase